MADIYKMDTDYLSAESVYDRTLGKKQSELNAGFPFSGSEILTLSSKFSSYNNAFISKYGRVVKVYIDATVGSTTISAWEVIATWSSALAVDNSTASTMVIVRDLTTGTVYAPYASFLTGGVSFAMALPLEASHRYTIGFTTVF